MSKQNSLQKSFRTGLDAKGANRSAFDLADQELSKPQTEKKIGGEEKKPKKAEAAKGKTDSANSSEVSTVKVTGLFPQDEAHALERRCLELRNEGCLATVSKLLRANSILGEQEKERIKEIIQKIPDGRMRANE